MAKSLDEPKVTRIKASDTGKKSIKKQSVQTEHIKPVGADEKPAKRNVFKRIADYFKGSWQELKLVRWPDRKTTWKMTGALVMFTAIFALVILLLDYGLQYLFKLLIGK